MKRKVKLSKIKIKLESVFKYVNVIKGYSSITITGDKYKKDIPNVILILNLNTNEIIYTNAMDNNKIVNWIEKLRLTNSKILNDLN